MNNPVFIVCPWEHWTCPRLSECRGATHATSANTFRALSQKIMTPTCWGSAVDLPSEQGHFVWCRRRAFGGVCKGRGDQGLESEGKLLALYLVGRNNFQVSYALKIIFVYTKDTSWGSLDAEPASWIGFADPEFRVHRGASDRLIGFEVRIWVVPPVCLGSM